MVCSGLDENTQKGETMILVEQTNGKYSMEGFSSVPMERLSYDPELDFKTREAENEFVALPRMSRSVKIYAEFSDPVKVANQYRAGASVKELAEQENMTEKQVRDRLTKMRVKMRRAGSYERN